jgi:hypothetical protein
LKTSSIISRYNHLSGKLVKVSSLKKFLSSISGDHGSASSLISSIKDRIQTAIDIAESKKLKVFRATITPVKYTAPKLSSIEKKPSPPKATLAKAVKPVKVSNQAKEKPSIKEKSAKHHGRGPVSAASLEAGKTRSFHMIDLEPRFQKDLVRLYNDSQLMFWGMPGEGKSGYCLQFANSLAKHSGLKVLYVASEEHGRSVFFEKLEALKAAGTPVDDKNLFFAGSLSEAGDLHKYDAIFLDSINHIGLKLKDYIKFSHATKDIIKVSVVQTTKDGNFRGSNEWLHEMDIAGEIVSRKLNLHKNRLDPNLAVKRRKHEMESLIAREKEKKTVREKVKSMSSKSEKDKQVSE